MTSLFQQLLRKVGLKRPQAQCIEERAAALQLPAAEALEPISDCINWYAGPPIQGLLDIMRSALSGPVQEDKARAHAALTTVFERNVDVYMDFDLREIDGICGDDLDLSNYSSLEAYASTPSGRRAGIIGYKDFKRAIGQALPDLNHCVVEVCSAAWLKPRLYWSGDQNANAFASAIAYARLRGLELRRPCEHTHYRIVPKAVAKLKETYHLLILSNSAWENHDLMRLLVSYGIPYARLPLRHPLFQGDLLLLSKQHSLAQALGAGLLAAGVQDYGPILDQLVQLQADAPTSSALARARLESLPASTVK